MGEEVRNLQHFINRWLADNGWTQTRLAAEAKVSKSDINGIAQGRIKLPGADKRRRLARAMGISHIDLLIAAGELADDEVKSAGVEGTIERDPDDIAERLCRLARSIPDKDRLAGVIAMLETWKGEAG